LTTPATDTRQRGPLSDTVIVAVASLVDDAGATREPSHNDLEFQIQRAGLTAADPRSQGQSVGKAKRIRAVLSWAIEHAPTKGEILVAALVSLLRARGGFRSGSPNFVGADAITDAIAAFREEGFSLSSDGDLRSASLENLSGTQLTAALASYVRRARRGSEDAALLVGTGKDLLEATAAHVLTERYGQYPAPANFPTLLGQAFTALGLSTPQSAPAPSEPPQRRLERAMYEAGCAVNALRNRQGTGHGRPWLSTVTDVEARSSVQIIGIVAEFLLSAHRSQP
jgi:GNAT superfamily N-acetyltransferase